MKKILLIITLISLIATIFSINILAWDWISSEDEFKNFRGANLYITTYGNSNSWGFGYKSEKINSGFKINYERNNKFELNKVMEDTANSLNFDYYKIIGNFIYLKGGAGLGINWYDVGADKTEDGFFTGRLIYGVGYRKGDLNISIEGVSMSVINNFEDNINTFSGGDNQIRITVSYGIGYTQKEYAKKQQQLAKEIAEKQQELIKEKKQKIEKHEISKKYHDDILEGRYDVEKVARLEQFKKRYQFSDSEIDKVLAGTYDISDLAFVKEHEITGKAKQRVLAGRAKNSIIKYIEKNSHLKNKYKEGLIQEKIWFGMSDEKAELILGEPNNINRTVTRFGTREQWVYGTSPGDRVYLYFENGELTSYQN